MISPFEQTGNLFKQHPDIKISSFRGSEVADWIPQIARLRIEVFREYPFLYIGDHEYERRYLAKFFAIRDAIVMVAFDRDEVIGVGTGFPFIYEADSLKRAFVAAHRNPEEYFCFGEFILKKPYRGLGIGKVFFEQGEAHVKQLNRYKYICFYTIIRPPDDPRRPSGYRSLAPSWKGRGYVEHPELVGEVPYQEIGESHETPKKMVFWIKTIPKK